MRKFIFHRSSFIIALFLFVTCHLPLATAFAKKKACVGHNCTTPLTITTTSLPAGQTTVGYSSTVKAAGGTLPYGWSIVSGALPTGLSIGAGNGTISGTPTVAGTFGFTVRVTDNVAATYNQGLSIAISATAPAPAPTLQISTASIPNGTVSVPYSTTLQATGGTGPYTWTQLNGTIPAGLALSSAGALTGTPTASGTYSFAVHVQDASATPETSDQAFAVTVAASTVPGAPIFSDNFESGNFAAWTGLHSGSGTYPPTVQSTIKHGGTYAYGQHYFICADSTNSACGAAHQDLNRSVVKILSPGLTHFFVRGYLYFKTPEAGATSGAIIQRKLIRFSDSPSSGGVNATGTTYGFILGSFNASSGVYTSTINLVFGTGATVVSACSPGTSVPYSGFITLNYNTWYSVELEIQLNTPAVADGIVRIWVGGVQVFNHTDINLRDSCTNPLTYFDFGDQADRTNYAAVDEYRYWDDIIISATGPIGP